jgi:CheY-like chemotaxis protein
MHKPGSLVKDAIPSSLKAILLVDDVDSSRLTAKWFFTSFGYAVDSVRTAEEALLLFDPKTHDVVVTDNSMPGMTGAEMAHIIKLRSPPTFVVMYTARPPQDQACLDLVIEKPVHLLVLKDALNSLVAKKASGASS